MVPRYGFVDPLFLSAPYISLHRSPQSTFASPTMEDERQHIGLTDAQMDVSLSTDHALLREGQAFVDREKASSQRHTLRTHWRGALFSLGLSFALVMEGHFSQSLRDRSLTLRGYDGIVGSFYGQPAFQQTFGTLQPDGSYQISANWQTTIGNVQTVGNLVGLLLTGFAQERYGSRKTYMAGMALMFCMIFLTVFSNSIGMFMAGSVLSALPWGMFQTLTTAYAAEICPINLRGLLASFVNMAWGIGLVLNVSRNGCLAVLVAEFTVRNWSRFVADRSKQFLG